MKAEQEELRRAREQLEAEQLAALIAQQNRAVLEAIEKVEEEDTCLLDLIEPLRTVPWELVAVGQSLQAIADKIDIYPMRLQQIEDALRSRKPSLETENLLAGLHSALLSAAGWGSKVNPSSWMPELKKWASQELASHSPFISSGAPKQKKEGYLEYKHLDYPQRLSLLHELCCAAMTRLLAQAAGPDEDSPPVARQCPLGHDAKGRAYWLGADCSGLPVAWVLRESSVTAPQRSRLSVLSSEGTPVKGDRCECFLSAVCCAQCSHGEVHGP
jgi:hypothetical protein